MSQESSPDPRVLPRWVFVLTLVVLSFSLYYPARTRLFHLDEPLYFAELERTATLLDRLKLYDFTADRRYWKGDEVLYRPLLFAWLGLQHYFFAGRYVYWNIANILVHVIVVLCFFRLLLTIRTSWPFAWIFSLWFSSATAHTEMVLCAHMGGYMLSFAFLLVALAAAIRMKEAQSPPTTRWLAGYATAALLSALFYEVMVTAVGLLGIYLAATRRRRTLPKAWAVYRAAAFPILFWILLYSLHASKSETPLSAASGHTIRFATEGLGVMVRMGVTNTVAWARDLFIPTAFHYDPTPFSHLHKFTTGRGTGRLILNVGLLGLTAWVLRTAWRAGYRRQGGLSLLLTSILAAYAAVYSYARGDVREPGYHFYLPSLLFLLGLYSVMDFQTLRPRRRLLSLLALSALVLLNIFFTYQATRRVGAVHARAHRFFTAVSDFVEDHRRVPDFSFAFKDPPPADVDMGILLVEGYPRQADARRSTRYLVQILYPQYYRERDPAYWIEWEGESVRFTRRTAG